MSSVVMDNTRVISIDVQSSKLSPTKYWQGVELGGPQIRTMDVYRQSRNCPWQHRTRGISIKFNKESPAMVKLDS